MRQCGFRFATPGYQAFEDVGADVGIIGLPKTEPPAVVTRVAQALA